MSRNKLTHWQLFALIYDELATQLGDSWPTVDLLRAADQLSKLIDDDFKLHRLNSFSSHSNYYTHNLAWAFSERVWQIACVEQKCDLLTDERLAFDVRSQYSLKYFLNYW